MTIRLAEPWHLGWWLLIPVVVAIGRRRRPALAFSHVGLLEAAPRDSLRLRLLWLPTALRIAWLSLLVLALARPQVADMRSAVIEGGPAILLVLDTSGSMDRIEARGPDGDLTRLDLVKDFVHRLLADEEGRPRRPYDRVGLLVFSRQPLMASPLTTDHRALLAVLESLSIDRVENRTNIGDALALAVAQLSAEPAGQRLIILCSDGAHNVESALPPSQGARLAESMGIPIHTLALASAETTGEGPAADPLSLQRIASISGGRSWLIDDVEAWQTAGRELDRLVSAGVPRGYRTWHDRYQPFLLAMLVIWLFESVLRWTWLRVRPEPFADFSRGLGGRVRERLASSLCGVLS